MNTVNRGNVDSPPEMIVHPIETLILQIDIKIHPGPPKIASMGPPANLVGLLSSFQAAGESFSQKTFR